MVGSNYPPGVSAGTPNAPWNDEPMETCDECGGVYAEDGHESVGGDDENECIECGEYFVFENAEFCPYCGSPDIQGLPCPNDGMNMRDLEDAQRSHAAEMKMDRMREKERFE